MARHEACLIDVYETVLTVDVNSMFKPLAVVAGVSEDAFRRASDVVSPAVTIGAMTMGKAMEHVLRSCGVEPSAELVGALVDEDRERLLAAARLCDDAIEFLEILRKRNVRSAFVSNCGQNTRPLLAHLGIDNLVDAVVLSCEVGSAKPSAQIYLRALTELSVAPHEAVLVDDQSAYCDGARTLGIAAVQIARRRKPAVKPEPDTAVVRSLMELESFFSR